MSTGDVEGVPRDLLQFVPQQLDWHGDARCADIPDADIFFPERGASTTKAKAICNGCTVKAECLQYAVDNKMDFGLWGGMGAKQRRMMWSDEPKPMRRRSRSIPLEREPVYVPARRLEKMLRLVKPADIPRQLTAA